MNTCKCKHTPQHITQHAAFLPFWCCGWAEYPGGFVPMAISTSRFITCVSAQIPHFSSANLEVVNYTAILSSSTLLRLSVNRMMDCIGMLLWASSSNSMPTSCINNPMSRIPRFLVSPGNESAVPLMSNTMAKKKENNHHVVMMIIMCYFLCRSWGWHQQEGD